MRRRREPTTLVSETPAHDHRLELAATMLLALAAIATAWATYQSSVWRGKQAEAQSASIAARVESTREAAVANRQAQIDLALFTQWIDAYAQRRGRARGLLPEALPRRVRACVRGVGRDQAARERERAALALRDAAVRAGRVHRGGRSRERGGRVQPCAWRATSSAPTSYMLAVVLFAISLFFAALSMRLRSRDIRDRRCSRSATCCSSARRSGSPRSR